MTMTKPAANFTKLNLIEELTTEHAFKEGVLSVELSVDEGGEHGAIQGPQLAAHSEQSDWPWNVHIFCFALSKNSLRNPLVIPKEGLGAGLLLVCLFTQIACTPLKVKLGWKVYLEKTPVSSIRAKLPNGPGIAPGVPRRIAYRAMSGLVCSLGRGPDFGLRPADAPERLRRRLWDFLSGF